VIDAKVSPVAGRRLLDEVARITPNPITHVILTHGDGDHVMGLASFPVGLTIIAHENRKRSMEAANPAGFMGTLPTAVLPNQTFNRRKSVVLDGVRFELFHFGPSHTNGDAIIYLPDCKVAFAGDVLAWGASPTPTVRLLPRGKRGLSVVFRSCEAAADLSIICRSPVALSKSAL
jgi:cyclase